ncbi:hypothetical protein [Streptomyces coffeae]|uniref:Uncharacterized protein n=1 Tax=Streptomyces coffeae TaxID=621382 RepID=A0ABS1NQJ6_9ACTN|nr:hypothetical protein [Streptomyces coffeae]MBL1102353.1 hypothetical protein [Streptomyces coffeae]
MGQKDDHGAGSESQPLFGKNLAKQSNTLEEFKKRLDEVLIALDESPAGNRQLSEQSISRDAYGGTTSTKFESADALAELYKTIHVKLETFSKAFGDQIEAFGLLGIVAEKNLDGLDAEQARRLDEIRKRVEEQHGHPKTQKPGGNDSDQAGGDPS